MEKKKLKKKWIFASLIIVIVPVVWIIFRVQNRTEPEQERVMSWEIINETLGTTEEDLVEEAKKFYFHDVNKNYSVNNSDIFKNESVFSNSEVFDNTNTISGKEVFDSAIPIEDSEEIKDSEKNSNNNSSAVSTKTENKESIVVIDESPDTMIDNTINEYKGEAKQEGIEFFDVEPEGKMPNGDIPAGGKQNVGTWN